MKTKDICTRCGVKLKLTPPRSERIDCEGKAMSLDTAIALFMPHGVCRTCTNAAGESHYPTVEDVLGKETLTMVRSYG